MKIGDKVRYLNAVGGGVVTQTGSKGLIIVLEEDGFETPVLESEVVIVEQTNNLNFNSLRENPKPFSEIELEMPQTKPEYIFKEEDETQEGEKINLFFAFLPLNIKQLQSSEIELFLVNESNYYVNFQILIGNQKVLVHTSDVIEPQTNLFIKKITKEQVNNYEFIHFQGFAFKKNKIFELKPSIDVSLKINPVDFYKLHNFKETDFFENKAMIINILEKDFLPIANLIDTKRLQEAMQEKNFQQTKKQFAPPKKQEILEVDLHIAELIDNYNNLNNSEILNIQLDKFNAVMKENIKVKGKKIVFIHGKGEGVLRKEIENQLKKSYKNTTFQDASFQQYGFGATLVTIH